MYVFAYIVLTHAYFSQRLCKNAEKLIFGYCKRFGETFKSMRWRYCFVNGTFVHFVRFCATRSFFGRQAEAGYSESVAECGSSSKNSGHATRPAVWKQHASSVLYRTSWKLRTRSDVVQVANRDNRETYTSHDDTKDVNAARYIFSFLL